MRPGPELLKEWIERRNISQREAANEFGWPQASGEVTVSYYINRKRKPGLDNAMVMMRVAGIPIESWSLSEVSKSNDGVLEFAAKRKR